MSARSIGTRSTTRRRGVGGGTISSLQELKGIRTVVVPMVHHDGIHGEEKDE